jgi:hypothetical protein
MKTSGTNLEHARVHNRRVIIEAVRLHGELTCFHRFPSRLDW